MKITFNETTSKEVNIDLPYYCKGSTCFYKVVSEKQTIIVERWCDELAIKKSEYYLPSALSSINVQITKEEFDNEFNEVLLLIS